MLISKKMGLNFRARSRHENVIENELSGCCYLIFI
jgi:hypothetical protein